MRLLIVNYHYVRSTATGTGIYPVSPAAFRRQVEHLGSLYRFISEPDLVRMIDADRYPDANLCLLTFDDALREQWAALEILSGLSVPAVCYATTEPLSRGTVHDVHKLHHVLARMSEDDIVDVCHRAGDLDGRRFDQALLDEEYRYDSHAMQRVKFLLNFMATAEERRVIIDQLFQALEPDERAFARRLYMDAGQLAALARAGMLGTHTRTHRPLAALSPAEIDDEIASSMADLRAYTGEEVRSISYPYGGPAAVSPQVAETARAHGLRFGLTMVRGFNDDRDLRAGMLLRRVDTNDAPGGKLGSTAYVP